MRFRVELKVNVKWKKRIRFNGFLPKVVMVPHFRPQYFMANILIKLKSSFHMDLIDLTEYKLTHGELPSYVTVIYHADGSSSEWKELSAVWESPYHNKIEISKVK